MRNLKDIIARRQRPVDPAPVPDLLELHDGMRNAERRKPALPETPDENWFNDAGPDPVPSRAPAAPALDHHVARPTHPTSPAQREPMSNLRAALGDSGMVGGRPQTKPPVAAEPRSAVAPPRRVDTDRVVTQPNGQTPPKKPVDLDALAKKAAPTPPAEDFSVPAPTAGRAGPRAGRVKTRLLGFEHSNELARDPVADAEPVETGGTVQFPVGWLVVVKGPGRGTGFALANGVSQIGRSEDQAIPLAFGDTTISRNNHAAVAYDDEEHKFFLGHGGKSNLVRLNGRPVLSTEQLATGDRIRIGETTLQFVALCGEDFAWNLSDGDDNDISP